MDPQDYSTKLFNLISTKADAMDFQDLYYLTFGKQASKETVADYVKMITPPQEKDVQEEYYDSYSYSYEESYDE